MIHIRRFHHSSDLSSRIKGTLTHPPTWMLFPKPHTSNPSLMTVQYRGNKTYLPCHGTTQLDESSFRFFWSIGWGLYWRCLEIPLLHLSGLISSPKCPPRVCPKWGSHELSSCPCDASNLSAPRASPKLQKYPRAPYVISQSPRHWPWIEQYLFSFRWIVMLTDAPWQSSCESSLRKIMCSLDVDSGSGKHSKPFSKAFLCSAFWKWRQRASTVWDLGFNRDWRGLLWHPVIGHGYFN